MLKSGRATDYRDRSDGQRKQSDIPAAERNERERLIRHNADVQSMERRRMGVSTVADETELERCERDIQTSFEKFTAAFTRIKNKHLYRDAGYASFTEYCAGKWGFSRDRGYQILAAEKVMDDLGPECRPLVSTERVARALAAIPEKHRKAVIIGASKAGKVTPKTIKAEAEKQEIVEPEIVAPTKPTEHTCPTCGQELPKEKR